MTFNTRKAAESAQQVADNVLSSAQATIGKTRSIADDAIDSVDDTVREVHGYAKQGARVRLHRRQGAERPARHDLDSDRCAGDRACPAP